MIAPLIDTAARAAGPSVGASVRPSLGMLWDVLAAVPDPEIPVVSIVELGILRGIEWDIAGPSTLVVTVTPTYSGCPATDLIMTFTARRSPRRVSRTSGSRPGSRRPGPPPG